MRKRVIVATGCMTISAFKGMISNVPATTMECFYGFINILKKYKSEVIRYFNGRNTNGFVEGFNNKVKILRQLYYSISNLKRYSKKLDLDISEYHVLLGDLGC